MAALAHLTAMDGGNGGGLQEQSLPCASRHLPIHGQWPLSPAVSTFASRSTGPAPRSLPPNHQRPATARQAAGPSSGCRTPGGQRHSVSEWDGKLLVINFWATWCPPCLHEIPVFIALQERYRSRGVQFLGVARRWRQRACIRRRTRPQLPHAPRPSRRHGSDQRVRKQDRGTALHRARRPFRQHRRPPPRGPGGTFGHRFTRRIAVGSGRQLSD
ncbi:MAG: TlpA family protein disulfide reductase [Gammaproteobacteria bacterium]|nr:MAG: TlpA family protein disulfide reductase [Gammaproteobacteria bacterium]